MPLNGERARSRHPLQLWVLITSFVYSVPGMVFAIVRPGSLQAVAGPVATVIWSVFLFLGTGLALLGIFRFQDNRATGLSLEEWGCFTVAAAALFDSIVIIVANGWPATFSALMLLGLSAAFFARARQLHRLLSWRRWDDAQSGR